MKIVSYLNGIILLTGGLFMASSCGEERESYTVKRADIVESVYSSITVEPHDVYKVNTLKNGIIHEIFVLEGDTVQAGAPLFYIDDIVSLSGSTNARLQVDQARKNLSGETNVLEDLKLELKNLELKRKTDSLNHSRISKLYDKKLVTRTEFEQADLIFSTSKNAHQSMKKKILRTERDLRLALDQAKNNYVSSLSRSDESMVKSLIGGKVYSIAKERGELVSMQETVAVIGSANEFKIVMLIDEIDITSVHVGQKIIITLEAYPGKTFQAKVTKIAPRMDSRTQTFEVEGEFVQKPGQLYYGLTGEGNILVKEKKNTIVIPREFLVGQNEVETSSGIRKVKVGAMSFSQVEILEGLKENDVILKPL
jgi:HlyD family secretion protein